MEDQLNFLPEPPEGTITYVKKYIRKDDVIKESKESIFDLIIKAQKKAAREGIEANSIVIDKNLVKVPSTAISDCLGGLRILPTMICGLNAYWTSDELPNNYSFAIFQGRSRDDRLAEFESIGMEPDELRKAADIYRAIKESL